MLCLSSGTERRRSEQGLSVISSLSEAPSELTVLHMGGVPLTPQTSRSLKTLFSSAAPAGPTITLTTSDAFASAAAAAAAAACKPPPAGLLPPLRLHLYGYDFTRPPAGPALESLAAAAAPRLTRLELWGCVGWPKRLGPTLQSCTRLHHLAVSFQPLLSHAAALQQQLYNAAPINTFGQPSTAAATTTAAAAAAAAAGAVASFSPVAAAGTFYLAVHSLGRLHSLRSLEFRGCSFNVSRHTASSASPRSISKSAAARYAEEAAAPSPQQLACALYQLTGLTRLALDGLPHVTPLLTTLTAMRGLRCLELPDVSAGPPELASIAQAAPHLHTLTLGGLGQGTVLGLRDAGERAAVATARPPEPLPLPTELAALNVVRTRPTLRTMRALRLALEARAAAAAAKEGAGGKGSGAGAGRVAVVVPGIEIDMPDVEFDPLLAFHRAEDGVMRSTMLAESAEALAAAVQLLAPPPPPPPPRKTSTFSNWSPRKVLASFGSGSGFASGSGSSAGDSGGGGCGCGWGDAASCDAAGDEADLAVGNGCKQSWQQDLVIHNVQGSLDPPAEPVLPSGGGAAGANATAVAANARSGDVAENDDAFWALGCPAVGHAAWILRLGRLGLRALELYGIGLQYGDLEAVATLATLQRLALVGGELTVEGLPCLVALPQLAHLELSRCTPRRRTLGAGGSVSVDAGAVTACHEGVGAADAAAAAAAEEGDGSCGGRFGLQARAKRALLELCVAAPALKEVFVVRSAGTGGVSTGPDGPLGAEWVRRQLGAMAPRGPAPREGGSGAEAALAAAVAGMGSAASAAGKSVGDGGCGGRPWPEVRWE